MERSVIANTLVILGLAIAMLTLIDLLMTDRQKDKLSDNVISLWNSLDDLKKLTLVGWIQSHRGLISLFAAMPPLAIILYAAAREIYSPFFIAELVGALIGLLIGLKLISFVLEAKGGRILIRATGTLLLSLLPLMVGVALMGYFHVLLQRHAFDVYFYVAIGAFIAGNLVTFILLAIWLLVVGPLVLAYIATPLLYASEQLVRRVAEYPKGPVLALSALCGGVAALLKIFGE
jgi:hypothetical protein